MAISNPALAHLSKQRSLSVHSAQFKSDGRYLGHLANPSSEAETASKQACPFRLTHPGVGRTGCGRSSLAPKDTPRGPTCSVWSFKRKAEEDRGEPH